MDINAISAPTANKPSLKAWHRQAADRTTASSAEQVWQSLGADESDDTVSGKLFQLELAAYSPLSNNNLTHYRIYYVRIYEFI